MIDGFISSSARCRIHVWSYVYTVINIKNATERLLLMGHTVTNRSLFYSVPRYNNVATTY